MSTTLRTIRAQVLRSDPGSGKVAELCTYQVEVHEGARVLHVLHAIRDTIDPDLAYRYCCESGQCGSCAVKVNGMPVLACTAEARDGMKVEPLDLPVTKDLVVDLRSHLATLPCLLPAEDGAAPPKVVIDEIKPLRSCIECLSCVSACPAIKVAAFAGPTVMRQEMRLALDPRDRRDRVPEAVEGGLYRCTSCQACRIVCPKEIAIPGKAIERLRASAHRLGFTLPRHREVAALVKDTGRSVARQEESFLELVPDVVEPDGPVRGTVAFFVGCMYTLRLPRTALDAVEVLRRNGIRVIVPKKQVCCGSPLIRTGQIEILDQLQEQNIQVLSAAGADCVMTMCAGCGSTLKHDYQTPFPVRDFNEVLDQLGIEPPARLPFTVTYHDPCHLFRGQGIGEQPRALIRQVAEITEMPAVCCGSGGGVKSGFPEEADALGKKRGDAIAATGAEQVITSCPFCELHIRAHTDRPVRHVASLLLEGYRKKDSR